MSYDHNEMMLELFRAEVETHAASLTNGLLKLENDANAPGLLDGMMRAAHSIKGAARIVRIMPAVEVSHVMEDCFVAAQRGELVLEPNGIDVLLQSVDLLAQISNESKSENANWDSFKNITASTVAQLRCVLQGRPVTSEVQESRPGKQTAEPETKGFLPTEAVHEIQPVAKPAPVQPPVAELPVAPTVTSVIQNLNTKTYKPSNCLIAPKLLVADSSEVLRHELLEAFAHEPPYSEVVLDLSKTDDLDAVGLALLHSAVRFAEKNSRELKLQHASPMVHRVLSAVGIARAVSQVEGQG